MTLLGHVALMGEINSPTPDFTPTKIFNMHISALVKTCLRAN